MSLRISIYNAVLNEPKELVIILSPETKKVVGFLILIKILISYDKIVIGIFRWQGHHIKLILKN